MEKPKIGISIGDVNGIGPEIIIKTFSDKRTLNQCTPVIYASANLMVYYKKLLNADDFSFNKIKSIQQAQSGKVNVLESWNEQVNVEMGQETELAGRMAHISLDSCIHDVQSGALQAMVTAPINKKSMKMADFPFAGHTEYLAQEAKGKALMMLCCDDLRVALVTTHIPISEVASSIDKSRIVGVIERLNRALTIDFGIGKPNIAVLGLNPHAGDQGVMGDEEAKYITPAILEAKKKGILAHGPFPADGFFGSQAYKEYDAVLAMYHDQGLVVFKNLAFGNGVNYTAGLDLVRTSPDHGTGFDIVGKNLADPGSFRNALFAAIDISRNRFQYHDDRKNKLIPKKKKDDRKA